MLIFGQVTNMLILPNKPRLFTVKLRFFKLKISRNRKFPQLIIALFNVVRLPDSEKLCGHPAYFGIWFGSELIVLKFDLKFNRIL